MLSKSVPAWILWGGFVLTCIAGSVNAVGFLGVHHQALSHMSGTATIFSTELAGGRSGFAAHAAWVLVFFFLGCMLSGLIIRRSTLQAGRRYGVALAVESALLFAAAYLLRQAAIMVTTSRRWPAGCRTPWPPPTAAPSSAPPT
jgi:uncharacterized membrane protein YoaK (UPF0700 family)